MNHYHVIARRYRPQCFADVLGQDNIVTALQNSLKSGRIAHAYLFSGSKGTGKTTLARLFAKALNCSARSDTFEPCNKCASCLEIKQGTSLDLLEIDGASNRGIDDVRKLQESIGYRPLHGRYTLYLIDEVHMLTKEAFNALLKTLEEPPAHVIFLFATTEMHKLPATILSRCQRFFLRRIPEAILIQKLSAIVTDLGREAEERALARIACLADGAFRDAESLLDQLLAFHEGTLTEAAVEALLGLSPRSLYLQVDEAGAKGELQAAFTITEQLFTSGVDFMHFFEGFLSHIRTLLTIRLAPTSTTTPYAPEDLQAARLYEEGQLLHLFDYLTQAHERLRKALSPRMTLESILLYVLRSHRTLSFPQLIDRLDQLEKAALTAPASLNTPIALNNPTSLAASTPTQSTTALTSSKTIPLATTSSEPNLKPAAPISNTSTVSTLSHEEFTKRQSHYETILQFASIELPGRIEKTVHFSK